MMIPPWLRPKDPKHPSESAVGHDPEGSEKAVHLELLGFAIGAVIVWCVIVGFFSILFQSVWPIAVGVAAPAGLFLVIRAIWSRIRTRG